MNLLPPFFCLLLLLLLCYWLGSWFPGLGWRLVLLLHLLLPWLLQQLLPIQVLVDRPVLLTSLLLLLLTRLLLLLLQRLHNSATTAANSSY
jgi:hypothetical protein